jgi:hypothetical protein
MQADDPWLLQSGANQAQSVTSHPTTSSITLLQTTAHIRPKATIKTPMTLPIPGSYKILYRQDQEPLSGARALLNDYTKSNSACLRYFYGHWNRHHVKEVALIVKKIDDKSLTTPDEVMSELLKITLINPRGSLARRIQFLNQKFDAEQKVETTNTSGIKI